MRFAERIIGMKSSLKTTILVILLTIALTCGTFASLRDVSITMSPGLTYLEATEDADGGYEQYYALEYTPGGATKPSVLAADTVWGRDDPEELLAVMPGTPIAAVNADFYTMTTGVPEGIQILNGALYCSDSWQNAVGILGDGTFFIGRPELIIKLSGSGKEAKISYINKPRTKAGLYLYTPVYGGESKITGQGTNVLLRMDASSLAVGGGVSCTVVSIASEEGMQTVSDGYLLLSSAADGPVGQISMFAVGDKLTLTISCADSRWERAVYACGAGEMLVENGLVVSKLSTQRKACTALGIRSDGSVVLLAGDGKVTGCVGSSLARMAEKLADMGCVTAVSLDGGGSTTLIARYPGDSARGVMNTPSDSEVRPCANYIVFENTAQATGKAASVYLRPALSYALPGADVPFTVTAADTNLQPVSANAATVTASVGSIVGTTFTAPQAGDAILTASLAGAASGTATIRVLANVDTVRARLSGTNVSAVSVDPWESLDLDAAAYYYGKSVYARDDAFTWTVSPEIGSIDTNGVFTAPGTRGLTGMITVSYGGKSATVNVTLGKLPTVLSGFEYALASEAATLVSDPQYAHNGAAAATIDSSIIIEGESVPIEFARLAIPDGTKLLSIWARGSGTLALITDAGETSTVTLTGDTWQFITFPVPANAKAVTGARILGVVTLDQLVAHPKADASAESLVAITIDPVADTLTATVRDGAGYIVRQSDITLYGDGAKIPFGYDAATGVLSATIGTSVRRVTTVARDAAGNLTRATAVRAGMTGQVFADMDGHWAADAANTLYRAGVVTGSEKNGKVYFDPEASATREQAAVMLARALKLDTSAYQDELTFADAGKISSWAVDSVRTLVSRGIMKGTEKDGKTYFEPSAAVTRAEIATLLGRTLERGYAESAWGFADAEAIGGWARPYIAVMRNIGVIGGYSDGTFRPNAAVTRAELATMFDRLGYGK
ncbi:MAG: S-layer homology domain-containing protein [Clostridiaceae bacterium]|nr:S-layer homology domain-containing protein [Clostridiaceae bacterium]